MKLKFIKAEDTERNAKATVHASGKLGFSSDAIEYLEITEGKAIQFAQNAEDDNDINLYAVIHDSLQEGDFRLSKAGKYFYVSTKNMFDNLNIDYKRTKIIYDLVKTDNEGIQIIKMIRREINKKPKEMPT
jgi:hypothetical protein